MKSMAKAILFGGVILAAQAAMADGPAYVNRADGIFLPPRVTYADQRSQDRLATVESPQAATAEPAFVNRADGIFLPVKDAYARQHASDSATVVGSAFPGAIDESGIFLPAHATFADTHLGGSAQAGTEAGAN